MLIMELGSVFVFAILMSQLSFSNLEPGYNIQEGTGFFFYLFFLFLSLSLMSKIRKRDKNKNK